MGHQLAKYRNRQLTQYGITHGQSKLLHMLILEEGRVITQRDIERKFSISPSTVTSMLNTLERGGFLYREVDASDARVRRIHLTDKGRSWEKVIYDTAEEAEMQLLRVLDPAEREVFAALLKRLADNVWEMSREGGLAQARPAAKEHEGANEAE